MAISKLKISKLDLTALWPFGRRALQAVSSHELLERAPQSDFKQPPNVSPERSAMQIWLFIIRGFSVQAQQAQRARLLTKITNQTTCASLRRSFSSKTQICHSTLTNSEAFAFEPTIVGLKWNFKFLASRLWPAQSIVLVDLSQFTKPRPKFGFWVGKNSTKVDLPRIDPIVGNWGARFFSIWKRCSKSSQTTKPNCPHCLVNAAGSVTIRLRSMLPLSYPAILHNSFFWQI